MRNFVALAGVLLVVGCGTPSPSEELQGTWQISHPDGCGDGMTFNGDAFTTQEICRLSDGSYGDDIVGGTFITDGKQLGFVPTQASCPARVNPSSPWLDYAVSGNRLTIFTPGAALIFERFVDSGGGGAAVVNTGCWNSDGTFTPSPVVDL